MRGLCEGRCERLEARTDQSILMRKSARPTRESNPAASDMIRGGIPIVGQRNVLAAALRAGCRHRVCWHLHTVRVVPEAAPRRSRFDHPLK